MQRYLELYDDPDAAEPRAAAPRPRAERDAMAWPPAPWEAAAGAWRHDTWSGAEPFIPFPPDAATQAPEAPSPAAAGAGIGTWVREAVETLALAFLLFFGIRLVVQNFKIEGSSMEPTLHSGQYLLVNKLAYRVSGEPQRGDIVVFESWTPGKDFIKRVIGLPGDTVEVRDNAVWINGERLEEQYLDQVTTGPGQVVHLGDGEFYVMGDNRGNSSDSRNHGALDGDQIIGKAWFTYYPVGDIGFISDGSSAETAPHAALP